MSFVCNVRTWGAAMGFFLLAACGSAETEDEAGALDRFTAAITSSREAVAPLTCDAAPPSLPEVGTIDVKPIPFVRVDLRTVPDTTLPFQAQEIVSNLTYLYGIETADYDCDGGWDISFWNSWSSISRDPKGAVGYMLKSNSMLQQTTERDTWPGLIQTGLYLFERHKALDINGDGFLDIIGAGNSNSAFIAYLNPGATNPGGLWTRRYLHTLSPGPINLALHDMDGDGLTDVVITMRINAMDREKGATGGLAWLKNPGPKSKERWLKFTIGPSDDLQDPRNLQVADFDGNGRLDVYVSDSNTGIVSTYFQTVAGTWERERVNLGAIHGHFGTTIDENGDGIPEILQPTYLGIKLLRFDAAKRSWIAQNLVGITREDVTTLIGDVVATDIDKDGSTDIVFSLSSLSTSQTDPRRGGVFMMRKANDWKVEAVAQHQSSTVELKVLDYNGDGTNDIVANLEYPENKLVIYYQRPAATP